MRNTLVDILEADITLNRYEELLFHLNERDKLQRCPRIPTSWHQMLQGHVANKLYKYKLRPSPCTLSITAIVSHTRRSPFEVRRLSDWQNGILRVSRKVYAHAGTPVRLKLCPATPIVESAIDSLEINIQSRSQEINRLQILGGSV
jgi:hypothetical protein